MNPAPSPLELLDCREARHWTEAWPVGNGKQGAMHFGGVAEEHLQLNEDTLWTGLPSKWKNPESKKTLPLVREALAQGKYAEATVLSRKMQSHFVATYLPLGDLKVEMVHGPVATSYSRKLDLTTAVSSVEYHVGAFHYRREILASYPHGVLALRFTCTGEGDAPAKGLNLAFALTSLLKCDVAFEPGRLLLTGEVPRESDCHDKVTRYAADGRAMGFAADLRLARTDGAAESRGGKLHIRDASDVVVTLAMATSFRGPGKMPGFGSKLAVSRVKKTQAAVAGLPWADLRAAHVGDHQDLFGRVSFRLEGESHPHRTTADRVREYGSSDAGLSSLLFHYGRYLLIAASRPGSQPANLQGIWNDQLVPPWNSNYTTNINTEMNYWPAEGCGLASCAEPLFDFIGELSVRGRHAARHFLGCRGWTAFHGSDLWRQAEPGGNFGTARPLWSLWPMAAGWLCQHLHEHYLFTGDRSFLKKKAWPLMKGAAEFYLDWLVEVDGTLFTSPSTSPENSFYDEQKNVCEVATASGMDLGIIRDLFTRCLESADALRLDNGFTRKISVAQAKLKPLGIGPDGRLLEWNGPFEEVDPKHRHVSHLYSLHPAALITREETPDLFAAARKTLETRGDGGTGWSMAWKVNFWARLKDGERALGMIKNFMVLVDPHTSDHKGGGLYPNLFDAHPPFQIDGNYGVTAGILEMLVQSHEGFVDLLPALPKAWATGEVSGLRLRGGFELSMKWRGGRVVEASILSRLGRPLRVRCREKLTGQGTAHGLPGGGFEYRAQCPAGSAVRFVAG